MILDFFSRKFEVANKYYTITIWY